jgi:cysteine desulfurase
VSHARGAPIYLDYAATTPVDPRVAEAMARCLTDPALAGNPASATHGYGFAADELVAKARGDIAALIGAQAKEIIFTSGATEANNLALLGVARAAQRLEKAVDKRGAPRGHFVSARTEHKSVLDALKQLEREGFAITLVEPDEWGRVPVDAVRTALRPDTLLVSVMHANNELGCVNDIAGVAAACHERGVLVHTDASQSAGKWRWGAEVMGVDFLSLTAHKIYGPKGIGALYVREAARPKIAPLMLGGGHERGLRSGTLATHQIVGFGEAAAILGREAHQEMLAVNALRVRLMTALEAMSGVTRNTLCDGDTLPGIVNASFAGVEGESLITGLAEIAVSTGSACSSATREPSYVLRALGRDTELAQSSLRISFGRFTTAADIDAAIAAIRREVTRLRALAGEGASAEQPPGTGVCVPGTLLERSLSPLARRYFLAAARSPVFPEGAASTGIRSGAAGKAAEGTRIRFELEIRDGIVKSARFTAYGCPHTLAVVNWLCEVLEGAAIADGIPGGGPAEWARRFEVPVEKLGRLLTVEDALRAALGP